jgi:hypothetical protein
MTEHKVLYLIQSWNSASQGAHAQLGSEWQVIPVRLSCGRAVTDVEGRGSIDVVEALEFWVSRRRVVLFLEERYTAAAAVAAIQELIFSHGWSYAQFLVSSPILSELAKLHALDHHIRIGVVSETSPIGLPHIAGELSAYSVQIPRRFVTREFADECHARGIMVFADETEEVSHIRTMIGYGADGFLCSQPDRALRWRVETLIERGVPAGAGGAVRDEQPAQVWSI